MAGALYLQLIPAQLRSFCLSQSPHLSFSSLCPKSHTSRSNFLVPACGSGRRQIANRFFIALTWLDSFSDLD
jgi:hypothetical protein